MEHLYKIFYINSDAYCILLLITFIEILIRYNNFSSYINDSIYVYCII